MLRYLCFCVALRRLTASKAIELPMDPREKRTLLAPISLALIGLGIASLVLGVFNVPVPDSSFVCCLTIATVLAVIGRLYSRHILTRVAFLSCLIAWLIVAAVITWALMYPGSWFPKIDG